MNMWLVITRSGANNRSIYIQTLFISIILYTVYNVRERGSLLGRGYIKWGSEYFGGERS